LCQAPNLKTGTRRGERLYNKMNWLDEIIARKRNDIARLQTEEFRVRAQQREDFRDFHAAIRRTNRRVRIIAEAKSASPSAGVIVTNYDPAETAKRYQANGADAISVLTEQNYFRGKREHITAVREAVMLPILRKDFIIDERQIFESIAIGADAILLIVAALKPKQLCALHDCAIANKLSALVEVHTREEIGIAVDAGAKIIGINNRNLATLEVDLANAEKLLPEVPNGITVVSESGIRTETDLKRMTALPVDALLVGEGLMRGEISIKDL
jgi:indole-3-glycerol phosphate synthase